MEFLPNKKEPVVFEATDKMAVPSRDKEKSERAFKIFESSIRRAENLLSIDIGPGNENLSIPIDKILDSYRAVIVLSISALDAYVKTFLIVEIKQLKAIPSLSHLKL